MCPIESIGEASARKRTITPAAKHFGLQLGNPRTRPTIPRTPRRYKSEANIIPTTNHGSRFQLLKIAAAALSAMKLQLEFPLALLYQKSAN